VLAKSKLTHSYTILCLNACKIIITWFCPYFQACPRVLDLGLEPFYPYPRTFLEGCVLDSTSGVRNLVKLLSVGLTNSLTHRLSSDSLTEISATNFTPKVKCLNSNFKFNSKFGNSEINFKENLIGYRKTLFDAAKGAKEDLNCKLLWIFRGRICLRQNTKSRVIFALRF